MFFEAAAGHVAAEQDWVISKTSGKNSLKISPLYASALFDKHLGKLAKKFVFMSATLGCKSAFCKELGIPENECLYIDCESPFPPELSPIVILPSIKLSKDVYEKNISALGPLIDTLLEEHKGQRGIIHSANYAIQGEVFNRVKRSNQGRLTCRDMDLDSRKPGQKMMSNMDLLNIHMEKKDSVLVSPSMMTGVDLKDDLSAFQIVIKMPWGNLGDARIKKKSTLDPDWYANATWRNLVQACCRSTRHEKDSSVTYVLDMNFAFFYSKWERNLPNWFKQRLTS
jgi:Rad3-related DNA helicase